MHNKVINLYACGGREGLYLASEMRRSREALRIARQEAKAAEAAEKAALRAARKAGQQGDSRKSKGQESTI